MASSTHSATKATGRIVGVSPGFQSAQAPARRRRKRDERQRPTQRAVTPAGGGAAYRSRHRSLCRYGAWAGEVQGKIKSFDAAANAVVLEDGTELTIPPTMRVERQALKPGANVKASYEEKDGQKVATSIAVMPAK